MTSGHLHSLIVIGRPWRIHAQLEELRSRGTRIKILDAKNRDEVLAQINGLSTDESTSSANWEAVMIGVDGFFHCRPHSKELFEPFIGRGLKFVTGVSAGYDYVDTKYLTENKVIYANCPASVAEPTASTTVLLILQTLKGSSAYEMSVRQGKWDKAYSDVGSVPDVRDVTVGLVGMGRIGKLVKQKIEALGMKVIYNNRNRLPPDQEEGAEYHTLPSLLATADLVSLHTPLTDLTRHLLSDSEFGMMKTGSFLVNTSRGPVVDEEALVRAMESGKILRVGLDVFEQEPIVHPYLLSSHRATLLPHRGALTDRTILDSELEVLANYLKWTEDGKGNTPVNI